jgi:hypothetical protein
VIDVSSGDLVFIVGPVVAEDSEELQDGPDEEMVDYEPSTKRLDVNVVYLSSDGDFIGDAWAMAQFNFSTQSATF